MPRRPGPSHDGGPRPDVGRSHRDSDLLTQIAWGMAATRKAGFLNQMIDRANENA